MERYTYFDGGKWRLKIGDTEYSGDWVDRLAAYEETGLEPEELEENQNEAFDRGYQYGMNYSGRRWNEAFEIGYQSCLNYKGLRWDEAEELKRYREIGSIDRLRELAQAEKDGRLVVLPDVKYTDSDGDKALRHAMYMCGVQNNPVTRYTADAIAEKLTREAAEAALEGRECTK